MFSGRVTTLLSCVYIYIYIYIYVYVYKLSNEEEQHEVKIKSIFELFKKEKRKKKKGEEIIQAGKKKFGKHFITHPKEWDA